MEVLIIVKDILVGISGSIAAIITISGAFLIIVKKPKNYLKKVVREVLDESEIFKKLDNMDQNRENAREGQENENNRIYTKLESLSEETSHLKELVEDVISNQKITNEICKDLLRDIITRIYYKYIREPYLPRYEKDRLIKAYSQYIKLEDNTFVKEIYPLLIKMPPEPSEKE